MTIITLANQGIINIAIKAGEDFQGQQYIEKDQFDKLNDMVTNMKLPENTESTEIGTQVRVPDKWITIIPAQVSVANGAEIEPSREIATVYAVSVGNGDLVPVPIGFYYVGGNLETGVIISDNEADKYDGKTDKTTWEYNTNLKGNQFVWIPCEIGEYTKRDWGKQNANWETTIEMGEKLQVNKYGGFYVGRYEAGLANNIEEVVTTNSNQIYNKAGIPQSKAGQIPWVYIDWNNAKANAESMYRTDYVSSGLITGTQWDVMIKKITQYTDLEENDIITDSSKWGNYRNTEIPYKGRVSITYYSGGRWNLPKFGEEREGMTSYYGSDSTFGDLLTTGASAVTEKYHIYDVAGNVWEWTEEVSMFQTSNQYRVVRGASNENSSNVYPACYRHGRLLIIDADLSVSFRVVLYLR